MDVAIYLRKSRDESGNDDVLSKHRDTLTSIAKSNNWKYILYEEIASGERIAYRPVMQQLLEDVEQGKYEAVLVMDIDRLGRGNNKDWGIIYESFCNTSWNTKIVTPQRSYDLTEDTDEMMVDIQSLFAKMEYKTIRRRMLRGKIAGAKQGKWVCGNPPFPYKKQDGKLVVDEQKRKTYRLIIEKALDGESLEGIMTYLNINKIATPSGIIPHGQHVGWNYLQVKRILSDETALGFIIYGKSKGDSRKGNYHKNPREQWIKVVGDHQALITQEEFDKIHTLMRSRSPIPVAARANKHILSGLLSCKKCSHTMRITLSGSGYYCAICNHKHRDGTRCKQRGIALKDEFYQKLYENIFVIEDNRLLEIREKSKIQKDLQHAISENEKQLLKADKALTRLYELYEDGEIAKEDFINRRAIRMLQKKETQENLERLKMKFIPAETEKEFLKRINAAKKGWNKITSDSEKNKLLTSLISKIIYDRDTGNAITLEILYK